MRVWVAYRVAFLGASVAAACRAPVGSATDPEPEPPGPLLGGAAAEQAVSCAGWAIWDRPPAEATTGAKAPAATTWSWRAGAMFDDHGLAVAADGAGNVVFGSILSTEIESADGRGQIARCGYLSAFSASGELRFSRSVGTSVSGLGIAVDGDILAVVGGGLGFTSQGFARFSPDGMARWYRAAIGALRVAPTPDGGSIVVSLAERGGGPTYFDITRIEKLNATGNPVWRAEVDSTTPSIAVAADGSVLVAMAFSGENTLFDRPFRTRGGNDLLVAKLGPDGRPAWSRQLGSEHEELLTAWAATADGGAVLAGTGGPGLDLGAGPVSATNDAINFLVRLDAAGDEVAQRVSSIPAGTLQSLVARPSGEILRGGNFAGSLNLEGTTVHTAAMDDWDFGVIEYTPELEAARTWHFGNGGGHQDLSALAVDGAGRMLLAGKFEGHLELGADVLTSAGRTDAFVARVEP